MNEVVIVGAGPVGLMLACELRLLGVGAVVVERLAAPSGFSKALGIQGRGVDLLEARGLLPRFEASASPAPVFLHFSGLPLDISRLDGRKPRFLFIPQAKTEALLNERAAELGVTIFRGHTVCSIDSNEDGVSVGVTTAEGERTMAARYLVGCDGGRSAVRDLCGIPFPGSEPTMLWRIGDVRLSGVEIDGRLIKLPGGKTLPFGVCVPLGDGYFRVTAREHGVDLIERDAPMAIDELRDAVRRAHGVELPFTEARWLSRFTDASRQAATYRAGNVFLAGDAAHTHLPAGGPGISTGFGDAANLGWKLAAAIRGWAPDGLLDSYHRERHPAGARVLLHTRAQAALMTPTANVAALRELLTELLHVPATLRAIVDLVQGAEAAQGRWLPFPGVVLPDARGALFADQHVLSKCRPWSDRIDLRPTDGEALLVRPDGYVSWAGEPGGHEGLEAALETWFGPPHAAA